MQLCLAACTSISDSASQLPSSSFPPSVRQAGRLDGFSDVTHYSLLLRTGTYTSPRVVACRPNEYDDVLYNLQT